MSGLLFTSEERDMLEQERELARINADIDLFIKVSCILRVAEGLVQRDVAAFFGVPLRSLELWIQQYRTSGLSALIKGPYPGKATRLSSERLKELAAIIEKGPEKAGLNTGVWNAKLVGSLIKTRFGVSYSLSQVRRILRKLRFSLQMPRRALAKADPDEQKEWLEDKLPKIEQEVRSEDGVLLYEDEASFQQSGSFTRTWCVVGMGCEVKSFPTRTSVKAFGAVRVDKDAPKWHFRFESGKFNADSFISMLNQLTRYYKNRIIHLIIDNAPYHKSTKVRKWVAANAKKLKIHPLPPYSPQFNATEYVWRKVKRLTTHNRYFASVKELASELFKGFNRLQGNPASLRTTIAGFA
jgi:transposase